MKLCALAVLCLCVAVKASGNKFSVEVKDADEISEMYAHYEHCPSLNEAHFLLDDFATLVKKADVKEHDISLILKAAFRITNCWKLLKHDAGISISGEYDELHENFATKVNLSMEKMSELVVKEFQDLALDFNNFNEMLSENIGNPIETPASLETKQATCQQLLESLSSATQIIMTEGSSQNINLECIKSVQKEVSSSLKMIMEIPVAYGNDLDMSGWKQFSEEILSNSIFKAEIPIEIEVIRRVYALKFEDAKDYIDEVFGVIMSQVQDPSILAVVQQDIDDIVDVLGAQYNKFCETIDNIDVSLRKSAQASLEKSISSAISKAKELRHAYCPFTLGDTEEDNNDTIGDLDFYDIESTSMFSTFEEEKEEPVELKPNLSFSKEELLSLQQALIDLDLSQQLDSQVDYGFDDGFEDVDEDELDSDEIKFIESQGNNNNSGKKAAGIATTIDVHCRDVEYLQEWGRAKLFQLKQAARESTDADMREKMRERIADWTYYLEEAIEAIKNGEYSVSETYIDLLNAKSTCQVYYK